MTKKGAIRKELTPREQVFLDEYWKAAGDLRKVEKAGFPPSTIKQIMSVPVVRERLMRSVEVAKETLQNASPHLVNLALQLVNDESVSTKVRASLLDSLLDRAGVSQPKTTGSIQISINTEISDRARKILSERIKQQPTPVVIDVQPFQPSDADAE